MTEPPKRILIIDDEPELCEMMNAQLKNSGFEFIQAYDGDGGFQAVVRENPDCILLDVRMPRQDGLTFLRKFRSYRDDDFDKQRRVRSIPVIVLTAAGDNMRALFETEGIKDYITKPFDIHIIKARILSVIQAREKLA